VEKGIQNYMQRPGVEDVARPLPAADPITGGGRAAARMLGRVLLARVSLGFGPAHFFEISSFFCLSSTEVGREIGAECPTKQRPA